MDRIKSVKAAIFGHAVADAVGVPTEFLPRERLMADPITDMIGYGSHNMPKGTWSDDTSMTLCALQSMIVKHEIDFDDIMKKFARWEREGWMTPHGEVFDIGGSCLRAISRYLHGEEALQCGGKSEHDNGNGSLMRIIPFSLYSCLAGYTEEQAKELARLGSSLTHAHRRSCIACEIYDRILRALIEKPDKETVREVLRDTAPLYAGEPEGSAYARLFAADFEDLPLTAIKSSGYVVHTLEASIWCLLNTQSYRDCVLLAANLGEDTDTVAAIAGGLAGLLYGYDAIPAEWITSLAKHEMIDAMCEAFVYLF